MSSGNQVAPNGNGVPPPHVPIDPSAVTTSSLKALQSDDQRKVMDIVDKLRRTGLSGIVALPQLGIVISIYYMAPESNSFYPSRMR